MEGVGRVTDTIDHYDYAGYLAKVAIENFERIDIFDCLEEYVLENDLDLDELSSADASKVKRIMQDMAYHMS